MGLSLPTLMFRLAANQPVTSSIVPVTITGFSVPVAINQRIAWKLYGGFSLGATGGFRFAVTPPAGIGAININYQISENATPATFQDILVANANITNAAAVADDYRLLMFGSLEIGATAGNVLFQFAQNNSTANPITLYEGLTLEVNRYSVDT
jgi:hypothetical protein